MQRGTGAHVLPSVNQGCRHNSNPALGFYVGTGHVLSTTDSTANSRRGGAAGVGAATTQSVVTAITVVIAFDTLCNIVLVALFDS